MNTVHTVVLFTAHSILLYTVHSTVLFTVHSTVLYTVLYCTQCTLQYCTQYIVQYCTVKWSRVLMGPDNYWPGYRSVHSLFSSNGCWTVQCSAVQAKVPTGLRLDASADRLSLGWVLAKSCWSPSWKLAESWLREVILKKDPAYGRQSISRPMRIVAPKPKKKSKIKLFERGDFTLFMSKSIQIWDHFFH